METEPPGARYPEPEIRTADLTQLALDLACWERRTAAGWRGGTRRPPGRRRPGNRCWHALDDHGATDRGRRLSQLGLHPRLARALLDGAELVGARTAAEVVALIDDDTLAEGVDADDELRRLRSGVAPVLAGRGHAAAVCCLVPRRRPVAGGRAGRRAGPIRSAWLVAGQSGVPCT